MSQTEFNNLKSLSSDLEFVNEKKTVLDYRVDGNTAVIPIKGVITPNADFWSYLMGWSTVEEISAQLDKAANDKSIKSIILYINSPGGDVDGIPELAENINSIKKLVIAYISNMGASGGYWLAAAADKIVMHRTAFSGSIGVRASYYVDSEEGESVDIVSDVSPNKIPDIMTKEGVDLIKKHVNDLANIFVKDIAQYRKTTIENVSTNFGRGDILIGRESLKRGMVDMLGSFKTALNLSKQRTEAKMNIKLDIKSSEKDILVNVMNDEDKIESLCINEQWLIDNSKEMHNDIKNNGVIAERARLNAIDELKFDSKNEDAVKLVLNAKQTGIDAKDLAVSLNQLGQTQISELEQKRIDDATELAKVDIGDQESHAAVVEDDKELSTEVKSTIQETVKELWRVK